MNFEIDFSRNVGLFFGAGGLLATFKNIIGDMDWNLWNSLGGDDSGSEKDLQLWAGDRNYSGVGLSTYSWYQLSDEARSGEGWTNLGPGVISISQLRLVIGLVLHFMR